MFDFTLAWRLKSTLYLKVLMPMMTIFEPLFILCFLATVATLMVAAVSAIRGNRARAAASLRKLGICAAVYLAALLVAGAASQRKVYRVGDMQCFDDWCITVIGAARTAPHTVEVSLRLSSRAKQRPMGRKVRWHIWWTPKGAGMIRFRVL